MNNLNWRELVEQDALGELTKVVLKTEPFAILIDDEVDNFAVSSELRWLLEQGIMCVAIANNQKSEQYFNGTTRVFVVHTYRTKVFYFRDKDEAMLFKLRFGG